MSDLSVEFENAQKAVTGLKERPDNAMLLRLYALYKQATAGDCGGERPGIMDFINRAKFDAWSELKGTSREAAMQAYVDLVRELTACG